MEITWGQHSREVERIKTQHEKEIKQLQQALRSEINLNKSYADKLTKLQHELEFKENRMSDLLVERDTSNKTINEGLM